MELLSAVTKQAVDILSQDPSQLATELINWLKPFSGKYYPYFLNTARNYTVKLVKSPLVSFPAYDSRSNNKNTPFIENYQNCGYTSLVGTLNE